MIRVRGRAGTVNFSTLSQFAEAPSNYREACEHEVEEPTPPMLLGTCVHFMVLGPRAGERVVCSGTKDRRSKEWKSFAAENAGATILTETEWAKCVRIADAIRRDPVAAEILDGARTEVPLSWASGGFPCSTLGVDIISKGRLAELKLTRTAKPWRWQKHAEAMLYHAQLAFYEEACVANCIDVSGGVFVIGAEYRPPFNVTVLKLTPGTLEKGRKCVALWLEKLRICEESEHFPGYVQAPVDWEIPDGAFDLSPEDLEEDDDEAAQ